MVRIGQRHQPVRKWNASVLPNWELFAACCGAALQFGHAQLPHFAPLCLKTNDQVALRPPAWFTVGSILFTSFYKVKSPPSRQFFIFFFRFFLSNLNYTHTIPNNIDFANHLCFIEGICAENRKDNLQIPTFNRISMILENSLFPFSAGTSLL